MFLQAFWNWVENYPAEFTRLYQRPQTDMAGEYWPIYNYASVLLTTLRNKKYCVNMVIHFPGTYCS